MSAKDNKQRLVKMTRDERRASDTGGMLDRSIPNEQILKMLDACKGVTFDIPVLLDAIGNSVGWYRLSESIESKQLSRQSRIEQAEATVAVIDELVTRLRHVDAELDAYVNDTLYRARGEFLYNIVERISPDLQRIRAALNMASEEVEAIPAKRGRKTKSNRNQLLTRIMDDLGRAASKKLATASKTLLAVEIVEACGIKAPTDDREQRRAVRPKLPRK